MNTAPRKWNPLVVKDEIPAGNPNFCDIYFAPGKNSSESLVANHVFRPVAERMVEVWNKAPHTRKPR